MHDWGIPGRGVGHRRPCSQRYQYIRNENDPVNEVHNACPSCWYYYRQERGIMVVHDHIFDVHHPANIYPYPPEEEYTILDEINEALGELLDCIEITLGYHR
jgi:hypothetical protein